MRIKINRAQAQPLYLQIHKQIERAIVSGELPKGFVLPSERRLALDLGVNRNTTIRAYEQLKDDGLVDSLVGKGTFVIYDGFAVTGLEETPDIYWDGLQGTYSFRNSATIMKRIMHVEEPSDMLALSGGFPSKEAFPQDILAKLAYDVFMERRDSFFHSPVKGDAGLLAALKGSLYDQKAISVQGSELMVTSGAQQGLNLIIDTFIRPGDRIITENPTFFGAIHLFRKAGASIVGSDIDSGKMDLNHVEYNLRRSPAKFIYLVPNYQNPTGYLMDMDTRLGILYLSRKYQVPIIEEDPYGELYYDRYMPTLKSLDRNNSVIYIGTFSKSLSPGFRVGYIAADQSVVDRVVSLKQFSDIHANTLSQRIIERFITGGHYESHLERMRIHYREKRDMMLGGLAEAGDALHFNTPEGGYYVWCGVGDGISVNRLHEKGHEEGFDFIPGEFFYPDAAEGAGHFRLNFTCLSANEIMKGVDRLIQALHNMK